MWKNRKSQYVKSYFEGVKTTPTKAMQFGTNFEDRITDQTQTELRVEIQGIPMLAYLDVFNETEKQVIDDKTGKTKWTQEMAEESLDAKVYSLMIWRKYGWIPKFTLRHHITQGFGDNIEWTGETNEYHVQLTEDQLLEFEAEVVSIAQEISAAYTEWQQPTTLSEKAQQYIQMMSLIKELEGKIKLIKDDVIEELGKKALKKVENETGSLSYRVTKRWSYPEETKNLIKDLQLDAQEAGTAIQKESYSVVFKAAK